jgi:ketol-acid reductoisomerase
MGSFFSRFDTAVKEAKRICKDKAKTKRDAMACVLGVNRLVNLMKQSGIAQARMGARGTRQFESVVVTKLPCTRENMQSMQTAAREMIKTSCANRVSECINGKVVVSAMCPSNGAERRFISQLKNFEQFLKQLKR